MTQALRDLGTYAPQNRLHCAASLPTQRVASLASITRNDKSLEPAPLLFDARVSRFEFRSHISISLAIDETSTGASLSDLCEARSESDSGGGEIQA